MKLVLSLVFLFVINICVKAQYNDTLYYKSGMVKAVYIKQHDEKYLYYEYRGKRDKLVVNRIPIDTLKYFVIYNEYHEKVYDSRNPDAAPKEEENEEEEIDEN